MKISILSRTTAVSRRLLYGVSAAVISAVAIVPALVGQVSAAQVSLRSVQMSNATPSATGVTYRVTFTVPANTNYGGIVVDFCGDSPIIGSTTCTLPTGFTLGTSVTLAGGYTGMGTGWATTNSLQGDAAASNKQVAVLTNGTPQAVSTATPVQFELTGVTNPSSTGTFYARIYTFATSAATTSGYTATGTTRAASPGHIDYGGVAMSTDSAINITAVVQEQLTFCVSKTAPASGCTSLATPSLSLGSGTPVVLSTALATDTAYHQVTTNAVNNVNVYLKNTSSATCAGLSRDGGSTCPIAAAGQTLTSIGAGSGLFGLRTANGTGGTGTVTANASYADATNFAMRTQTYGTYGDLIATTTGAVTDVNSELTYGAAAAAATPAGVYTATHSLIATGSY